MGILRFAPLSDGTCIEALNSFHNHEEKLTKIERKVSKKTEIFKKLPKAEAQASKTAW
ncbi:MAG: hypothetical protein K5657_05090 [Desulfovibrio sp.]|nr:hypothetical protein [Desulfovibrio sp.]